MKADGSTKKIDMPKVQKMLKAGIPQRQVAEMIGVTPQAVNQAIKRFELHPALTMFQGSKAEILESLQASIVESVDSDCIKAANLQQRGTVIGILEDKIRTIRGQETSISTIDIRALFASVSGAAPQHVVSEPVSDAVLLPSTEINQ